MHGVVEAPPTPRELLDGYGRRVRVILTQDHPLLPSRTQLAWLPLASAVAAAASSAR
jgi:hypothetical protein